MKTSELKVKDALINLLDENNGAYEFLFSALSKHCKPLLEELVALETDLHLTEKEQIRKINAEFYNKLRNLLFSLKDQRVSNLEVHVSYYENVIENNNKFINLLREE